MGYTLKVTTDDVHTKAQRVQTEAADLEAKVAKLSSDMQALADTWTGTASGKFQTLYNGWKGQARQIQSSLEQIGTSLNSVGSNYEQVEAANAASL